MESHAFVSCRSLLLNSFCSSFVKLRFDSFIVFVCCSINDLSFVSKLLTIGVVDIEDGDSKNDDEGLTTLFRSIT